VAFLLLLVLHHLQVLQHRLRLPLPLVQTALDHPVRSLLLLRWAPHGLGAGGTAHDRQRLPHPLLLHPCCCADAWLLAQLQELCLGQVCGPACWHHPAAHEQGQIRLTAVDHRGPPAWAKHGSAAVQSKLPLTLLPLLLLLKVLLSGSFSLSLSSSSKPVWTCLRPDIVKDHTTLDSKDSST
jgi:hypothetical protein